ncbi:hypothetical protein OpiT1DRAFT_01115 [Opitutaceae bacterium TAV1]|nr:hypothetical protein OpiT1DRAFT_01115 [Opitutaceae bacterium TAV1]
MSRKTFPASRPRNAFYAVTLVFAALASPAAAFTEIETDFASAALPPSLAKYGNVQGGDGLTLTTSAAPFNRAHLRTTDNDIFWTADNAPVAITFTLDTFTSTNTAPGTLSLIVVGNETEGNGHLPIPDYTPAAILGISLTYNAETGKYDVALNVKTNAPKAGFTGKYFRRVEIRDIASVNLGTFGFIISADNKITLIVNGQPRSETYTMPDNVAWHFRKAARVYLVATNRDKGQPASFRISSFSIKKEAS